MSAGTRRQVRLVRVLGPGRYLAETVDGRQLPVEGATGYQPGQRVLCRGDLITGPAGTAPRVTHYSV